MDRRSFLKGIGTGPVSIWLLGLLGLGQNGSIKVITKETIIAKRQEEILRPFCCDCAEWVVPAFEKAFPKDKRFRDLLELTRKYGKGEIPYSQVEMLRNELWELYEVLEELRMRYTGTPKEYDNATWAITVILGASAKPITQDVVCSLLDEHLWVVRNMELQPEINLRKESYRYRNADQNRILDDAAKSLITRIRDWQMRRLTSYLTGTEETLIKHEPPREFVPMDLCVGIKGGLDYAEIMRRVEAMANGLGIKSWL